MNEVKNNVIKASFYAKQFAASNNENAIAAWPKNDEAYGLKYDFTFSCDKPVLVDTVTVEAAGPLKDVKTVADDGSDGADGDGITDDYSYGHPILARQYDGGTSAATVMVLDPATTIKVNGRTLVDTNFEVSDDEGANTAYIKPQDFALTHLNPGQTLNFRTEVNFRAYTDVANPLFNAAAEADITDTAKKYGIINVTGATGLAYYPAGGIASSDADSVTTTPDLMINTFAYLTNGNATELEDFDFDIFKVNVDYISLTGSNAQCALSLPDDPTTYPTTKTLLINLATTGDSLIKNFEAMVNCNDKPTRIVGSELKASHAVGASAVAASNLKIEAGGKSMSFKLTDGEKLEASSNTQPKSLSFDSGNIVISGQVPQVSGVLLSLTYHTSAGNTCSIVTQ